jgi:hypothetical protein
MEGFFTSDFIGDSVDKPLPLEISKGACQGAVVTVSTLQALLVAMNPLVNSKIIAVDHNPAQLQYLEDLLRFAGHVHDRGAWIERIKRKYADKAADSIDQHTKDYDFNALKNRRKDSVILIDGDLASKEIVEAIKGQLGAEKIGVIYASNIEMYLGNTAFKSQQDADKNVYCSNLLSLMDENTILIRGGSVQMNCHRGLEEAKTQWAVAKNLPEAVQKGQ